MTKRETFILLTMIGEYYSKFDIDQEKVNAWFDVLKNYSFEKAKQNLTKYVAESPYPPRISDLVFTPYKASNDIPNVEETLVLLYRKDQPAKEEIVQVELAKMRQILGIERES